MLSFVRAGQSRFVCAPPLAALALSLSGCGLIAGVEEGELAPGGNPHAAGYAAEVLADGPLAYWRLGDPTTPLAVDSTGNGHDGTYRSATLGAPGAIAGDPDTAAHFDGDAEVTIGDKFGFEGLAPFTVEAWIKPEIDSCSFLGKVHHDGSTFNGWLLYFQGTELTIRRGYNLAGRFPPLGEFTHVVSTYDGVTLVLYENGQLQGDREVSTPVPAHSEPFTIGRTQQWVAFQGVIDEVAVYDYNLSPARILAHYEVGTGAR